MPRCGQGQAALIAMVEEAAKGIRSNLGGPWEVVREFLLL